MKIILVLHNQQECVLPQAIVGQRLAAFWLVGTKHEISILMTSTPIKKAETLNSQFALNYDNLVTKDKIISIEKITSNNCYSVLGNHKREFSSPFITSLTGILLNILKTKGENCKINNGIMQYLLRNMNDNKLINFCENKKTNYDIDTFCVSHIYLCLAGHIINPLEILNIVQPLKCNETGAYYTWFNRNRSNNVIDYFVNVHIFVLLKLLNINDRSLEEFLNIEFDKFIRCGSKYYADIKYPVFLIYYYLTQGLIATDTMIYKTIQKNAIYQKIVSMIKSDTRPYFPSLFNSSSRIFNSDIIHDVIHAITIK